MTREEFPIRRRENGGMFKPANFPFASSLSPFQRLFEDFFPTFPEAFMGRPTSRFFERGMFRPSLDVSENENEIKIRAELPGMKEDDIDVTMSKEGVTIRGEKTEEKEEGGENQRYHFYESSYGSFERFVPFSADIEEDKVKATFKNGVLKLHIPKSEKSRSKSRKIQLGNAK
jgi:HSP20 family protein